MAGRKTKDLENEISFAVSPQTLAMFEKLQADFGVNNNADVLRKALALADIAAEYANDDHVLRIIDKDNEPLEVQLASGSAQ